MIVQVVYTTSQLGHELNVRNNGRWTEARYRSFVTSALRSASRRWPPKYETLKEAFVDRITNKKTGKLAAHYKCASCMQLYPAKDVQVDHINPVVDPATGFVSWDVYIDRMFCEGVNLQVLCTSCHKDKTGKEKDAAKRLSDSSGKVPATKSKKPRVSSKRTSSGSRGSSRTSSKSSKR